MISKLLIVLFILVCILLNSCSGEESANLGNNLVLLEGDNKKDRAIVYCSGRSFGSCYAGIYVIPTNLQHMENGRYAEYVETAKSNNKWIIAKSVFVDTKDERYWIMDKDFKLDITNCDSMNCDSILQSHVKGPFDINSFNGKKSDLGIDLAF
jgi:hypothetical protein